MFYYNILFLFKYLEKQVPDFSSLQIEKHLNFKIDLKSNLSKKKKKTLKAGKDLSPYNVTETYTISRQTTFQTSNGYNQMVIEK